MARTWHWQRTIMNGLTSSLHPTFLVGNIAQGDTLMRVRGSLFMAITYSSPDTTVGVSIAQGLFTDVGGTGPTLDPYSTDINDQERWLDWSVVAVKPSHTVEGTSTTYVDFGPVGQNMLDSRSKRVATNPAGMNIWWAAHLDPALTVVDMFTWGGFSMGYLH
jgi:hypothetical protein